ncbi:MAG: hypothetical protein ACI4DP_08945, partial [Candidatus Ornithomonoglobus sp.]
CLLMLVLVGAEKMGKLKYSLIPMELHPSTPRLLARLYTNDFLIYTQEIHLRSRASRPSRTEALH